MAHTAVRTRAVIDNLTKTRLNAINTVERGSIKVIPDFAVFIDTHRDQPHVGVFYEDIHRGMCRPTLVDYVVGEDLLFDPGTKEALERHDKHLFVTTDYYGEFLGNWLVEHGADPRDGEGCLPTSHFRDSRAKVYELKSFREIVRLRYLEEQSGKKRVKRARS
jgi:hypothetical protein